MTEKWLPVVGFENDYEVSDLGRVRSLIQKGPNRCRRAEPKILRASIRSENSPYLRVTLSGPSGKKESLNVHTLVLEAFKGPRPAGFIGLHQNDVKTDNVLLNLSWGTYAQNAIDRGTNGNALLGKRNHKSKMTERDVLDLRRRRARGETQASIGLLYGISQPSVSAIDRGKTWRSAS